MARISLSEIPNAAGGVAVPAPGTPEQSALAARLAEPRSTLIAKASPSALSASSPASAEEGTHPDVAAVLQHWQWTKAQAGNAIASAQADAERSKFLDGIQPQVQDLPPDQQAAFVAKQLPKVREAISGFAMTPDRAHYEAQRQSQWEAQTLANATTQGTKQYFDQGRQIGLADFDAKVQARDIDGAVTRLSDLRTNHLINDDEYQTQLDRANAQLRESGIAEAMSRSPRAFNRDINELHHTGDNAALGGTIAGPAEAAMWKGRSDTQLGKLLTGEQQDLFTGIHGGTITRPDQVQAMVDGSQALDEPDLRAAQAALANASAPLDHADYHNLRVAVAQYDPKADPAYTQQAGLQRTIAAMLPSVEGGKLSEQLQGLAKSRPATANVDAAAKGSLQQLFRMGFMGSFVSGPQAQSLTGPDAAANDQARTQAAQRFGKSLDGWEAYHAANPDTSYDDARKWMYQQLKTQVLAPESAVPASQTWDNTAGPSDGPNAPGNPNF